MSQQVKDLTKNVQILLKRKTQQLMLARIMMRPEFLPFLGGGKYIRVFNPQKQMFKAVLRVDGGSDSSFHLEPRGVIPAGVESGTVLLLVFDNEKENFIVQCVVETFSFLSIGIRGLDPRTSARRLTLLPATFFNISEPMVNRIINEEIIVRRVVEYPDKQVSGDQQISRDVFIDALNDDPKEIRLDEGGQKFSGLLTDISSGGCCIHLTAGCESWQTQVFKFGVVQFDIPIGGGRGGVMAVLIRDFRTNKGNAILHCMFLEPLASGFLTV